MSLIAHFHALTTPSSEGAFRLGEVACPGCRLAKSHAAELALIIDVERTGASTPRRLENLRYEPPAPLEVQSGDREPRVEHLAVLVCRTNDADLQAAFLRIALAQLRTDGLKLSETDLEARLEQLVTLFRALGRPASQTIQGLWCELAMILWSNDPRLAITSWHSSTRALHDFAGGADRLEVKSCATGIREHAVRLEQLQNATGGQTLIASLIVAESDDGYTVADLCAQLLERVGGDIELARRVETIVTHSLGREWREAANRRFDLLAARDGLRLYLGRMVPTVPQPLPAEVKHVSFVVDLSTTDPLGLVDARSLGPFFQGILPSVDPVMAGDAHG